MSARFALCLAAALAAAAPLACASGPGPSAAEANAARVRQAFEDWRAGRGSVFDLLAEDVSWTVAGSSPVSGTYASRRDFMANAVAPINARLSTPISPQVRSIVAQDDTVVVLWDGSATRFDGLRYENRYAWHMVFADDRIVEVVAFLDTWALEALMAGDGDGG